MAENFDNVIKKLESTVKKPSAAKTPAVLAVQMVDSKGKVIKEERGAAAAEAQREKEKREKKTNTLLSNFLKALGGKKKLPARDPKTGRFMAAEGGFLKSMMAGLLPAGMIGLLGGASILGKLGIGALALAGLWAAVNAIGDGLKGVEWAKSMGMEKESGFIAKFFAGDVKGGLMNAFTQSMKGAAMGATLGMAGGPVGMIVGALLGAALFGISGYFGAGALAKMIDPLVQDARKLFGLTVNITPKELEDAKKVAATTLKLKNDAITNVKKLTDQIVAAQAATEPDQELIDKLILLRAAASKEALEAHKNHAKAATKALELDRAAESNAVKEAENAVKRNEQTVREMEAKERTFELAVKKYGEDTIEGQNAAAQLEKIRVKLRKTRDEGKTLREKEAAAEAVLLEEDRRLIKKAKEEGGIAPWRARFNVWTADTWKGIKDNWMKLTMFIPTWFANNIFDPGSAGDDTGSGGSPMRIFGVAIPSMEEIKKTLRLKWNTLKTSAISWFTNNIFDSGSAGDETSAGSSMRIFGVAIPSMKEVTTKIKESWNTLKTSARIWFADNIFQAGPAGMTLRGAKIFGVAIPSMEEVTAKIKESWSTLKTSAISWFKDNIFDPGSAGDDTGAGSPMKIFGMELKFPSLNISFSGMADKIMSMLPRWLTDPIDYIGELIDGWLDILPDFMKPVDPAKKIAALEERLKTQKKGARQSQPAFEGQQAYIRRQIDKLKEEAKPKQLGGPVTKGMPYLVGEGTTQGELFIPSSSGMILSAQRTQQMMQAGILRGMGGGAGGGGVTSINTGGNVVSSPTTNYVNNGIAARRPIILAA